MSEDTDDGLGRRGGVPGFILPVVTALAALVAGGVVGSVVVWLAKPPEIVEKQIPRELNPAELEAACAPFVAEVAANLQAANDKVTTLVEDVKAKEAKVQDLEAEMKRRGARGRELVKELEAAKAELEQVKQQLKQAIEEKEQLVVELKETLADLEEQKVETETWKQTAITNDWEAFLNQAQLDVCEKGNRKKLGRCREDVTAIVGTPEMKAKYEHCLKSGQEAPSLHEAGKDEQLPQFAEYLDQENKVVKDWYILLCDPTLPEAHTFATGDGEDEPAEPPGDAALGGLDDPDAPLDDPPATEEGSKRPR